MDDNTCKVSGCTRPVKVQKWQECGPHYHRYRTYGNYDTLKRTPSNATWDERLTPEKWTVTPGPLDTPCWIWNGKPNSEGYATIKYHQKAYKVYRVMWERANNRAIPPGMNACHRCDRPACVNPDHIFIGTQTDNIEDMVKKGRQRSNRGKTDEEVRAIRALYQSGIKQAEIARVFGTDSGTISRIVNRVLYKNVP